MAGRFAGKVALVTGGASGIGAAVVDRLVAEGGVAVVADRSGPVTPGPRVDYRNCDVTDEGALAALIDEVVERHGRIDLLVNNAGIGMLGETPDVDTETWRKVFAVNVDAVFYACRAAIPHMRRAGGGAIVNTASISGLAGDYGFSAYNASKAAVINLTRTLAIDHARDGIRVNALCPGFIARTGLTSAIDDHPDTRREWDDRIPMGRAGTAVEMANVITFLLSEEASYMTGAIVVADGGTTAHTGQVNIINQHRRRNR